MKVTLALSLFLLAGISAWTPSALADEVLPAAAATEDLRSFDQSVVVPANAAGSTRPGVAISEAARKLKEQGQEARRTFGATVSKTRRSGVSVSESSPSNAVKNSGSRPDPKTPKNSGRSTH